MSRAPSRYRIVLREPRRRGRLAPLAAVVLWSLSVVAAWQWASHRAAPRLAEVSRRMNQAEQQLQAQRNRLQDLGQRDVTLSRSDQISRDANLDLQHTLAQREEEIAGLRADVAFYERLVGPTSQPQGLNVHSSQFVAAGGATWKYRIVLTQNLNRGTVSSGRMRFLVEGVRDGRLARVDWTQLHQNPAAPEQPYSFRYFQELQGSVMLPQGFVPQRVRVSLLGGDVAVERDFDWQIART